MKKVHQPESILRSALNKRFKEEGMPQPTRLPKQHRLADKYS
uniref:Uncharacterized protein n=1 Tax=Manihot esculenta TaxID=3983 RepID=A0A2C9VEP3_MANES